MYDDKPDTLDAKDLNATPICVYLCNPQTVEDSDSEDYHYYSFDYIIYNRKNDRISSVSHSSVDYHQLGLARFGCLRE